jgi:large subunit ribosomal protein L9
MQVILLEKMPNLGNLGDVVRVKDGFARNFLLPQRKARKATPDAIAEINERRAELEAAQAEILSKAQGMGESLAKVVVRFSQKAGIDGRLFGSVTNMNIAESLKKEGFTVDKSQIRMPFGPIKTVGESSVSVVLHTDVVVDIPVHVAGEVH